MQCFVVRGPCWGSAGFSSYRGVSARVVGLVFSVPSLVRGCSFQAVGHQRVPGGSFPYWVGWGVSALFRYMSDPFWGPLSFRLRILFLEPVGARLGGAPFVYFILFYFILFIGYSPYRFPLSLMFS